MSKSNINNLKTSRRRNKVTTSRLGNDAAASHSTENDSDKSRSGSLSLPSTSALSEATRQDRNEASVNSTLELSAGIQVLFSRFLTFCQTPAAFSFILTSSGSRCSRRSRPPSLSLSQSLLFSLFLCCQASREQTLLLIHVELLISRKKRI